MIIIFKLVTSETIITDVVYEDELYFIVKNPLKINIEYDRQKKIRMMTQTRWMDDLCEKDGVMLLAKHGIIGFTIATKDHQKIFKDAIKFYEEDEHEEDQDVSETDLNLLDELNLPKTTIH
jgi:hypothetical protein